jgi:glycosyltransferase involved in cell wall biosynthesis
MTIVAQFIQTLGVGGAERLAVGISGSLADRGLDSHLIVLDGSGPLATQVHPAVAVHDLALTGRGPLRHARDSWQVFRQLSGIIHDHGIDTIQTHLPLANFWSLPVGWLGWSRVFPTIHNNQEFDYGAAGRIQRSMRRVAYGQMLRHAAGMIAVSDSVKTSMVEALGVGPGLADRISVVPNGVPVPPPVSDAARLEARSRLGLPDRGLVMAAVGRLCEQKNYRDLIAALSLLGESSTPWCCVIAGTGPLESDLRRDIGERGLVGKVNLAGHLEDPGLLYAAADFFVMPSLWEGLPMALLEAMAAGLPVVGYEIEGIREIASNGNSGLLVPRGDTEQLGRCLAGLVQDSSGLPAMGSHARKVVQSNFSFDRMVSQLIGLYRGLDPEDGSPDRVMG